MIRVPPFVEQMEVNHMKYVLLFCAEGADVDRFAAMTDDQKAAQLAQVGAWYQENRSRITGGNPLGPPETATTVRFDGSGQPLVTDGPFLEANEVIGGYVEVDVPDLDEALRLARTWPPRGTVEVRPVQEMG
jgi:hypothetical protein